MFKTIRVGTVLIKGKLIRTLSNGKIAILVGGEIRVGTPVWLTGGLDRELKLLEKSPTSGQATSA